MHFRETKTQKAWIEFAEYGNDAAAGLSVTIHDICGDKQLAGV